MRHRAEQRLRRAMRRARILAERAHQARETAAAEQAAEQLGALIEEPGVAAGDAWPTLVRMSGSELEIASDTFCAPPGAAAAVPSEARMAGSAAATTFCATASLTPIARARLLTTCGVRNWDTRLTRLIAIAAPLEPTRCDGLPFSRLS